MNIDTVMADLIPSGYRFSTVTSNDHGGLIYIAAFLGFTYSTLCFVTRCGIKWRVFGLDDWAMCVAQTATTIQFILVIVSLSAGLGKNFDFLTENQYLRMASMQYANQIVLYLSIGFSKIAAVLLIQRLFTRDARTFWIICNIVTALMVVWTIIAAFMVSVGCSPKSTAPVAESDTCPSLIARYQVIVITDSLTDILLVLVPAYLVWQLQMSTKLKLQVISAFAFRLPLLPLSILAFTNYYRSLHSNNPGVDRTPAIIFQQSELSFSLIAATAPCLKSWIRGFDTGSGNKVEYTSHGYSSNGYNGGSYKMQSFGSQNGDKGDVKVSSKPFAGAGHGHGRGRANTTKVTTAALSSRTQREEDASITSHSSQEMIIRRDVQWEVRREDVR